MGRPYCHAAVRSGATMHHRPADSSQTPRFTGPRTFMRLPHVTDLDGVDVAVVGVPTDDAVSFKSGARFGPEAIRSASVLLRPYNPRLGSTSSSRSRWSTTATPRRSPATTSRRSGRSRPSSRPVHEAGVVPLCLGGDHSMVLAELRAAARGARPARARAPRRARRRLGPVLRREVLPRHGVQARGRGGARSTRALGAGGAARHALRRERTSRRRASSASTRSPWRSSRR